MNSNSVIKGFDAFKDKPVILNDKAIKTFSFDE